MRVDLGVPRIAATERLMQLAREQGLVGDQGNIKQLLRHVASSSSHKLFATNDGIIVIGESDNFIAAKRSTQILACHADDAVTYDQLIGAAMLWFQKRKASHIIWYTSPAPSAADAALKRAGFESSGSMLLWRKYGTV